MSDSIGAILNNVMSEFDELYKELMLEMARPVSILRHDYELQVAYGECLKIMRKYGETNAPTYTVWDYIWRCLPNSVKTEEVVAERNKNNNATNLKHFIIDLIKKKLPLDIRGQLIKDLKNDSKIRNYVQRPVSDRGSRAKSENNILYRGQSLSSI